MGYTTLTVWKFKIRAPTREGLLLSVGCRFLYLIHNRVKSVKLREDMILILHTHSMDYYLHKGVINCCSQ